MSSAPGIEMDVRTLGRLLAASGIGLWDRDFRTGTTYGSDAFLELHGLAGPPVDSSPGAWIDAIHPDDRDRVEGELSRAIAGGAPRDLEYRVAGPGGRTRWLLARGAPVRDGAGQLTGYRSVVLDVTGHAHAAEAVRAAEESEERFRSLVEEAADAFFLHDREGRIRAVNRRACESLGYTRAELMGMKVSDVEVDFDPVRDPAIWARTAPGQAAAVAGRHRRRDGSMFPVEVRVACVELAAEPLLMALARDVSAQRAAEEALRESQARLADAHRLEVVGRLAGGVAHDFNNLLTVILAGGHDLRDRLRAGEPGDAETVEDILDAGERAAELTRQLLAFARKQVVAPTRLDLNEVLRQSRKLLSRVIGEDVRVTEDLQDGLWTVRADSGLLGQVVMNLAVNARDAMPRGGTLSMSTANVELGPGDPPPDPDMAPGRYVRLRVSDTGEGMGPEVLEHVFEPFFTSKPVGAGTGLGLATAYGNVKQSGGHVVVQSRPGGGSTFDVYLPALATGEMPTPLRSVTAAGGSERVLVVEDDAKVREIVERSLRSAGYGVVAASSGEEAVRRVEEGLHAIDLLVTDVVMPGMGGPEVARRVLERVPGVRALFVSGYTHDAIGRHGVLDEGIHFLPKPFTSESLLAAVRAVLDA